METQLEGSLMDFYVPATKEHWRNRQRWDTDSDHVLIRNVLDALLQGFPVTMREIVYRLNGDDLIQVMMLEDDHDELSFPVVHVSFTGFIAMCRKMTDEEYAALMFSVVMSKGYSHVAGRDENE